MDGGLPRASTRIDRHGIVEDRVEPRRAPGTGVAFYTLGIG
jgi:hypothetical protein